MSTTPRPTDEELTRLEALARAAQYNAERPMLRFREAISSDVVLSLLDMVRAQREQLRESEEIFTGIAVNMGYIMATTSCIGAEKLHADGNCPKCLAGFCHKYMRHHIAKHAAKREKGV
mgnify:CR=1 FL=1